MVMGMVVWWELSCRCVCVCAGVVCLVVVWSLKLDFDSSYLKMQRVMILDIRVIYCKQVCSFVCGVSNGKAGSDWVRICKFSCPDILSRVMFVMSVCISHLHPYYLLLNISVLTSP